MEPGDHLVLLWRVDLAHPAAALLGAGRIVRPARPRGERPWIDTVAPDDPAFVEARRLGYRGPENDCALVRLEDWTEDVREIRRRTAGAVPLVDPGGLVTGVPPGLLAPLRPGLLAPAPVGRADPLLGRLTVDPRVLGGKPVVRGLRIAVEHVLAWLAAGATVAEIVAEYPELEADDVRACLAYATRLVAGERTDPTPGAG